MQKFYRYFFLLFIIVAPHCKAQFQKDIHLGDSAIIAVPTSQINTLKYFTLPISAGTWILRSEDRNYSKRLGEKKLSGKDPWYSIPVSALPLATIYTLKLAGVPSKSSWERALGSHATGGVLALGLSQMFKGLCKSKSPDGTTHHSYPSDNAILAFASAAMLDEEYGHISPWISVGGYGIATTSAFLRINNNQHWIGDILNSFNYGTLAAKGGYLIFDIFGKGKGIQLMEQPFFLRLKSEKPSYLGVYSSANISLGHNQYKGTDLYFKSGYGAGIEGAWFLNPHFGIGGKTGVSYYLPKVNKKVQDYNVDYYDLEAGLYFSTPLKSRWSIGTHVLEGIHQLTAGKSNLENNNLHLNTLTNTSVGASIDYRSKAHMSTRFNVDYSYYYNHYHMQQLNVSLATCYRF